MGEYPFQTTIADIPGRRMGDEHKPRSNGTLPLTAYEPERGRVEGPRWIAQAIKEKVEKHYANAKGINLLIYANFTAHQMDYQSICDEIEKYKNEFSSIWVITNHQIFSLVSKPDIGEVDHFAMVYSEEELQSML